MSDTVLIAVVAMAGVVLAALAAGTSAIGVALINRTHHLVNSRMTELLETTRELAHRTGEQDERERIEG